MLNPCTNNLSNPIGKHMSPTDPLHPHALAGALEHQARYEQDPRIGTPIYALLTEFIDPHLTEEHKGTPMVLYGSKGQGEYAPHTEWPPMPEYDRPDGADKKQTKQLIAELRARRKYDLGVAEEHAVSCPYCSRPLLESGPNARSMFRAPVPEWAGGSLGWVHRTCRGR